ncbi:hypothetical protein [Hymenobacter canadensis]|uniref:Lipoprotein n=1 Tax=Hymenobacter canadensis TaxID=2999067 RepID=A0ABY7LTP1_9BACT|nr:hypothetical protein [Hymenobacter canadensis]WBA43783.1 hypothetical protein O3303_09495 [Hymenobacter canadensis]
MKHTYLLPAFALLGLVSGCAKDPAQEFKLSAEQLAWQPYRTGEVLRFGHDKSSKIRTYRVIEVQDRMETQYQSGSWLPFPQKEPPLYQYLTIKVQRTDSTSQPWVALDMHLYSMPVGGIELRAAAEWESFYNTYLPIDSVNAGVSIDTLYYPGIKLLPTVRLGPTTHPQVIFCRNKYPNSIPAGGKRNRYLYYAKRKGVVGFQEDGSGLWYRLP